MKTKLCPKCFTEKPFDEYYARNRSGYPMPQAWCKSCQNTSSKERYAENPQHRHSISRADYLADPGKRMAYTRKALYGITRIEYDKMLLAQGGTCAICGGVNANGRSLGVDHNHTTGKIRGLLCHSCNAGIGHLQDSVELLSQATTYLENTDG